MTDQELLELAAKSVGIEPSLLYDSYGDHGGIETRGWNALKNDGDAFLLVFQLKMKLTTNQKNKLSNNYRQCRATVMTGSGIKNFYENIDENSQDASPLRIAIVRAAAEIGKELHIYKIGI